MRENDMVAIMMFSPEASLFDLEAAGINADNTGIREEKEYSKVKEIRENNKFKDSNGNFSEAKFHEFYTDALKNYNVLAAGWQPTFHENNIFAPAKQRRTEPAFIETNVLNPFQKTASFKDLGEWGPQTKSMREIAESQQVYNTETGEWMDAPEESFFGTIGMGPLVLATWDFDADENGNPTTDKNKVFYTKGSPKLNDNGTFYYETLGNRSSHGKQLLHYSDIITKEDSPWNKIDFLDSDDLEKSVMGTVAKNVALVGSLFLPGGVGYAVTAATILLQSLKLGSTLGKMLLGSDTGLFNLIEAFADATDLHGSVSDYSQLHMWSWENLVQTAGDAIAQLRQLRLLFEAVPWMLGYGGLGKETGLFTSKGQEALRNKLMKSYDVPLNLSSPKNLMDIVTQSKELLLFKESRAMAEANKITEKLTNLSGTISKAYMTGITVNDMFTEAKEAGMSDIGAIAMTLGYAAAEYRLLSTGIGEMILPELRAQRVRSKQLLSNVADKLKKEYKEIGNLERKATTPEEKKNFFWKVFNKGKKLYEDNKMGLGGVATNAAVVGVGEGIEEVTEEFLADAIRGIHDLATWASGSDNKMMFTTENMLDKYAMNFIGGLIGGGVNGAAIDFKTFNGLAGLSPEASMRELIYKLNNGEYEEIKKIIKKETWGNKNLSASKTVYDEKTQNNYWQQAESKEDSQDEAIKTMLLNSVDSIMHVLNANGANISENSLFDYNTLKLARFSMLANTSTAARYSEEFTRKVSELVKNVKAQKDLDGTLNDEEKRDKESAKYQDYMRQRNELEDKRKELVKEFEEIKKGSLAARFIGTALLEIHPAVSQALMTGPTFDLFVLRVSQGKKNARDLDDKERVEWLLKYKTYKVTLSKDEAEKAFDTWEKLMESVLKTFAPEVSAYEKELDLYSLMLDILITALNPEDKVNFMNRMSALTGFFSENEANMIAEVLPNGKNFIEQLKQALKEHEDRLKLMDDIYADIRKKIEEGRFSEIDRGNQNLLSDLRLILSDLNKIQASINASNNTITALETLIKAVEDLLKDAQIEELAKREIINSAYLMYGPSHPLIAQIIDATLLRDLKDKKKEIKDKLTERKDLLMSQLDLSKQQVSDLESQIENDIKKRANEVYDDKALNAEKSLLNERYMTESMGRLIYYMTNEFNLILDSIKLSGYLNPITKNKLQRMLTQINTWIDTYKLYIGERYEYIGGKVEGDEDFAADYTPLPTEEAVNDYSITPDLGVWISKMDFFLQNLISSGYLSDYLVGEKGDGKLVELKSKIEDALLTPDSPVLKLLDAFALDVTGEQMNFSMLMLKIENEISGKSQVIGDLIQKSIAGAIDLDDVIGNIDQAIKLVDLLYSVLMGARSDNAGFELNQTLSNDMPNFGFHFGINSIINEVKLKMGDDSAPLLTINGLTTDNIVSDLHLISKTLKSYRDLYGLNSGLKLKSLPKIALRANQVIYKALRNLCDVVPNDPDDPIDKSMLEKSLDDAKTILDNLDKNIVDNATLEKIQKERIDIEDALFEFGEKNRGKKFLNIKELASIFKEESIILNESTEELTVGSLLGYLASRMSIKSSSFYNEYRKQISDTLAPLILLELEAYVHTANALNGNRFSELMNLFRNELLEYLNGLTEDEKRRLFVSLGMNEELATLYSLDSMKPFLKQLPFIPYYTNISFVEGIAGSGKTHGVLNMVHSMLAKVSPELLSNVMIAHTKEIYATNLGKGLKLKNGKYKDKAGLLEYISNWKKPSMKDGVYQYLENVDYIIEDGEVKPAYKLKDGVEVPSLIIIDEVGQYTDLELATIDAFAKKHGISVLTFGDLDQNTSEGELTLKLPEVRKQMEKKFNLDGKDHLNTINSKGEITYQTHINRGQLMHGFKLGFSIRTRSSQQDKNQAMILSKLRVPQGDITLHYYEGADPDSGKFVLNGAKVYNYTDDADLQQKEDEVIKLVDELVKTLGKDELGEQEKIGVIYQNENSRVYRTLKDKYGDLIEGYHNKDAQGTEAKYFVMETDWTNKSPGVLTRELNTGITRAKNGIIILSKDPMQTSGIMHIKSAPADASTKSMALTKPEIKDFSKTQKDSFDRIFSGRTVEDLEYTKRDTVETIVSNTTPPNFTVIKKEKVDSTYVITVAPVKVENDWLKKERGDDANTVIEFVCGLDGYNVWVKFEGGKIISVPGNIVNYVNVDLEEQVIVPPTNVTQGVKSNPESNPEPKENLKERPYDKNKTGFDVNEHTRSIKDNIDGPTLSIYTVAGAETGGFKQEVDNRNRPIPNRPPVPIDGSNHNSERVDSMNGLIKMLGNNVSYEKLLEYLLDILNAAHTKNRQDLEGWVRGYFENTLGIKDITNINLLFGIWTSSNKYGLTGKFSKRYSIWERSEEERSMFNDIEDPNISRRTFSLLIKVKTKGQATKNLLVPLGIITSPFTLALSYPATSPIGVKMLKLRNGDYDSFNLFVEDILNDPIIYQAHPELYNLFKLWHFDYAGFFPLVRENGEIKFGWNRNGLDTFALGDSSIMGNRGVLIMTNRGMRQINSDYLLHLKPTSEDDLNARADLRREFVPLNEWMKDTRLHHSSKVYLFTLQNKEGSITVKETGGTERKQPVIKGRPFILVSSKKYVSDKAMMDAYLNGNEDVRIVYLLPPLLSFEELMSDLIKFETKDLDHFTANDATAFHILNILMKNDKTKDIFEEKLKNVGLTNITKVKGLLKELEKAYNYAYNNEIETYPGSGYKVPDFSKFVTLLRESSDFFGVGPNKFKLRKVLRMITSEKVYQTSDVEHDDESKANYLFILDADVIKKYQEALEEEGFLIFDNVRIKRGAPDLIDGMAAEIETDAGDNVFTINGGRQLLMDARVTTPTFFSNLLNLFIDKIVNYYILTASRDDSGKLTYSNTRTDNRSIELSLYTGFTRELSDNPSTPPPPPPPSYTPSDNFDKLYKLDIVDKNGDMIPFLPTTLLPDGSISPIIPKSKAEEDLWIKDVMKEINTRSDIKKFAIMVNGKVEIIDYLNNNCLCNLEGTKNFKLISETEFSLEFGDRKFKGTKEKDGAVDKIAFEEILDEPLENVKYVDGADLVNLNEVDPSEFETFPLNKLEDDGETLTPYEIKVVEDENEVIYRGDDPNLTIEGYVLLLFNFLTDDSVVLEDRENTINRICSGNEPTIVKIREYLLFNYGLLNRGLRSGAPEFTPQSLLDLNQSSAVLKHLNDELHNIAAFPDYIPKRIIYSPLEVLEEESKCNKFRIDILNV